MHTRSFSGIVLQRNPVTNQRASHSFITGTSRNIHAVEPYFWLLFVIKTRFWSGFWQYRTCKYNEWQLGFGMYYAWLDRIIGLAIMLLVWAWCNKTTSMFDFRCGSLDMPMPIKLNLCFGPTVKEYGTAIRLFPDNRSVSGRCLMWLSDSGVYYVIKVLHWPSCTMKQNDVRYNRRNHRC